MTYGRVLPAIHMHILDGAVVSHLAELGAPSSFARSKALIRPSRRRRAYGSTATFSPRGEGVAAPVRKFIHGVSIMKFHA